MSDTGKPVEAIVESYCRAVREGAFPRAYRAILSALTSFKTAWEKAHPEDSVGALYPGYLDMSFVSVAPAKFGGRRLKISLVFLHPEGKFSLWLAAGNRSIQAETSAELAKKALGSYTLCELRPGVDAIIASDIKPPYRFDTPDLLAAQLVGAAESFIGDMALLLTE